MRGFWTPPTKSVFTISHCKFATVYGLDRWVGSDRPAERATAERVFSFAGLTLSDLCKSLLEGTLEEIMWAEWESPNIPLVPYLLMFITVDWSDSKVDSASVRVSELFRTEFLDTTINNRQTG